MGSQRRIVVKEPIGSLAVVGEHHSLPQPQSLVPFKNFHIVIKARIGYVQRWSYVQGYFFLLVGGDELLGVEENRVEIVLGNPDKIKIALLKIEPT